MAGGVKGGVWRSHGTSHIACSALPLTNIPPVSHRRHLLHQQRSSLPPGHGSPIYQISRYQRPFGVRFFFQVPTATRICAPFFPSLELTRQNSSNHLGGWHLASQSISWCLTSCGSQLSHAGFPALTDHVFFPPSSHDSGETSHEKAMCRASNSSPGWTVAVNY